METKDLVLLMLMPIILISIVFYIVKSPTITGAVTQGQKEESNKIGTYSIMPSFKANINYNLQDDYKKVKKQLNNIIDICEDKEDIEQCFNDYSNQFNWNCLELKDEASAILYDFVDKFNECLNLKEDGVVCRFSLDEREIKVMKGHPRIGFLELKDRYYNTIRRVVVAHHEFKINPYPRSGGDRRIEKRNPEDRRTYDQLIKNLTQIVFY